MYNLDLSRLTEAQIAQLCAKRPIRMSEDGCIMTGPVRMSFPAVAEKVSYQGGKAKYQSALLFPHTNMNPFMEACRAKLRELYPKVPDPNIFLDRFNKDHPIRDQALKVNVAEGGRSATKATLAGYKAGFAFINPKSEKQQPKLFHVVRGQWVPVLPEEITKVFYAGCWVEAKVGMYKSIDANPGLALGLNALWKLADDNTFGGGGGNVSAEEGGDAGDAFSAEDPNLIPQNDTWG